MSLKTFPILITSYSCHGKQSMNTLAADITVIPGLEWEHLQVDKTGWPAGLILFFAEGGDSAVFQVVLHQESELFTCWTIRESQRNINSLVTKNSSPQHIPYPEAFQIEWWLLGLEHKGCDGYTNVGQWFRESPAPYSCVILLSFSPNFLEFEIAYENLNFHLR